MFARRDAQRHLLQRRLGLAGIAERHVAEFDLTLQLRAMNESGGIGAFDWLRHQFVERFQRCTRILELQQHGNRLAERRNGAPAQHRHGDQTAHRQQALLDQIDAADDQADVDELRDRRRAVGDAGRQQAHLCAGSRQERRRAFPLFLHDAFRALRLDGFQRSQAFDQRGITHGRSTIGRFDQFVHLELHHVGIDKANGHGHQWNEHQRPGDPQNDQQKDQREGKIDQCRNRRGGDEIAHRLEGPQVRSK